MSARLEVVERSLNEVEELNVKLSTKDEIHKSERNAKVHEILNTISGQKYENAKIFGLGKYLQTQIKPRPLKVILPLKSEAQNCLKLFSG